MKMWPPTEDEIYLAMAMAFAFGMVIGCIFVTIAMAIPLGN